MEVVWLCLLGTTLAGQAAVESGLIRVGEVWKYFPGRSEPATDSDWRAVSFDDGSWAAGATGIGYASGDDATVLPDMAGAYGCFYLRKRFSVADPEDVRWLVLRADYEDGFCVYLNGREVLRKNVDGVPGVPIPFNTRANGTRFAGSAEEFDLTAFRAFLQAGTNVLAVQVFESPFDYTGASFIPELLANFRRGPFLQSARPDSIKVVWRTPLPTSRTVEYGTTAALGARESLAGLDTNHVVTLSQLLPDTLYYYRVRSAAGADEAVSDIRTFRTLKAAGSVRFACLGDSGSGLLPQINVAKVLRQLEPDLVVHAGDVVYPSFTFGLADTHCLSVYQRHMQGTPYFFAFGNHDIYSGESAYLDSFVLPTNTASGTEHYYSFDHGDAHFVVLYQPMLNQYLLTRGDTQYNWLVADLAASKKPWKLVFLHHPIATSVHHRYDDSNLNSRADSVDVKDVLLPVAQQHGVQLIVAAHAHSYERFAPTNGVHSLVTGCAGGTLYPFIERDVLSAQLWGKQHCALIQIEGDTLTMQAFDENGVKFDEASIRRAPAPPRTYQAAWHTPQIEPPGPDLDGNRPGETFDFLGEPIPSMPGEFSNPGRLHVDNDATHLHLGIDQAMNVPGSDVFLFVESPRLAGVTNLVGLGDGILDPLAEGADALDVLRNLSFTNFTPSVACVLGDEYADGTMRSFARTGGVFAAGQGVFRLQRGFPGVPGARLRQFNRSPQSGTEIGEQNADLMCVSLPYSELGGLQPGERIRVGVVVGGARIDPSPGGFSRFLDRSFLGTRLTGAGLGPVQFEGVTVELAPDPDADHDGLLSEEEIRMGLDPLNPDTDADGLIDGWEVRFGLNPRSPAGRGEGEEDPDSDGLTNAQEQAFGSNPHDAASAMRLAVSRSEGGGILLRWMATPGQRFMLEESGNPLGGFVPYPGGGFPRVATSAMEVLELPQPALEQPSMRFYRLVMIP
jgi:hypothetical protein